MKILGIHCYGHDTAAALVIDGQLTAAVEEERLSRIKHDNSLPLKSIQYCLNEAHLSMDQIDLIALSQSHNRLFKEKYLRFTIDNFPFANGIFQESLGNITKILNIEQELRKSLNYNGNIEEMNHHMCHLASAFYQSGFEESACISIDGLGEIESTVIGYGEKNNIKIIQSTNYPDSLGLFYSAITDYLGFQHHSSEGTVMALASFGNPDEKIPMKHKTYSEVFREMIWWNERGTFNMDLSWFNYPFTRIGWVSSKFIDCFGPKRKKEDKISDHHKNIAAGLQKSFEQIYLNIIRYAQLKTGSCNLSLAGGCALNCIANGKIFENTNFKDVYIQPAASDSGTAIGAALLASYEHNKSLKRFPRINHTYWGPSFNNEDIQKVLENENISYKLLNSTSIEAAKMLSQGKIIGWFQGRMEFGPRALGNRSILAAPFPQEIKDKINFEVKHREPFRPFAPSLIFEQFNKIYKLNIDSPFMIVATSVHDEWINKIKATIHVDNTARVHTVTKDRNLKYYELINEFYRLTSIPLILNTSFNDKGEPIVCSPKDALKTMKATNLDALFIGDYLII
ncbi:MAG: carbamoyl transferase [Desulfobacterales bacterium]|nr:carbamoyl transferase [Desulfobacterales bacterium]